MKYLGIESNFYQQTFFFLENQFLETYFIKKLLILPSVSYNQKNILNALYFKVDLSHSMVLHFPLFHSFLILLVPLLLSFVDASLFWIHLIVCKFCFSSFLIIVCYHCKNVRSVDYFLGYIYIT